MANKINFPVNNKKNPTEAVGFFLNQAGSQKK